MYKEIVYENMRNVVSKFIGRNEKVLNENLVKMATYYGFQVNVCNCFSGNEKGHVEGSVKVIRNRIFSKKIEFRTYEEAKEHLEKELIKLNKDSRIEEEKQVLQEAKSAYEIREVSEKKVDKYSFISVENNKYSTPDYLVGRYVTVRTSLDYVEIFSNNHFVCKHIKKEGKGNISIDIKHYLRTFKMKPGALKNSLALKSNP